MENISRSNPSTWDMPKRLERSRPWAGRGLPADRRRLLARARDRRDPRWRISAGQILRLGICRRGSSDRGLGQDGDCLLIGEGFSRAPEIAVIRDGEYQPVKSFDLGYAEEARAIEALGRTGIAC